MAAGPTVLGYEQNPEPPCVVRSPGRVALLMPPRVGFAFGVALLGAGWVVMVLMAAAVGMVFLRGGVPGEAAVRVLVMVLAGPLVLSFLLVAMVRWWLRARRVGAVLEVAGEELVFSRPGVWRPERHCAPLAEVEDVVFDVVHWPAVARRAQVRVSVVFKSRRRMLQQSFLCDPALAAEARGATSEAIGHGAHGDK